MNATLSAVFVVTLSLVASLSVADAQGAQPDPLPELLPLRDGGFEEGSGSLPGLEWKWTLTGSVRASATIDRKVRHSGRQSLRLNSPGGREGSPAAFLEQTMPVLPATTYRLSVWVKGEQVGDHNEINDPDDFWLDLPVGTYGWTRLEKRLNTAPGQTRLTLRVELRMPTTAMWLDDLRLEAEVARLAANRADVAGAFWGIEQVEGDDAPRQEHLLLATPPGFSGDAELQVVAGRKVILGTQATVGGGRTQLALDWNSGKAPVERLSLRVRVRDAAGQPVAAGERQVRKIPSAPVLATLARIEAALPRLRQAIDSLASQGVAVDYPKVGLTILEHFLGWTREDVARGEVLRATYAASDMLETLARAQAEVAALRADPRRAPLVTRYRTGNVEIVGTHFVADTFRSDGAQGRGPVFLTGYGHFGRVVEDLPAFPGYGINVIQIEIGPSAVLTGENEVSYEHVRRIQAALERAAKNNVAICLLLSPHYFPGWALDRWPDLQLCRGGFLRYCIDAPESRAVIEKFLRIIIPELRGRPGLHSLCLSNEPVYYDTSQCPVTRRLWAQWLAREHGDVATLNKRLGADYPGLDQVPIPGNQDFDAPQFTEWVLFNDERFTGWHRWMADIIHEIAPEIPVHAKIMAWTTNNRRDAASGVDPELFGAMGQISGNDCSVGYPGNNEWAMNWQLQNWFYDLQRTACRQPVFNTENHLTPDRSTHHVPGAYFRTALWQGAVHGQGAATIWVWERTYDRTSDFYGNVMHRPGCAEQTGRAGLDLLRLAPEVAALQQALAPVAFLYCRTAGVRSEIYFPLMQRIYNEFNFTGIPIGFVTDRMAARGDFGPAKLLVLPAATHVSDEAFAGIARFVQEGGRLLLAGQDNLRYDRFGQPRPAQQVQAVLPGAEVIPSDLLEAAPRDPTGLHAHLAALVNRLGFLPSLRLADSDGHVPRGVEFRAARIGRREVLNAVNYLKRPRQVSLVKGSEPARAQDLISGKLVGPKITLAPMEPVLLVPLVVR